MMFLNVPSIMAFSQACLFRVTASSIQTLSLVQQNSSMPVSLGLAALAAQVTSVALYRPYQVMCML